MAATRQASQRITLVMLVLASVTVITLDYRGEASHAINHVRDGVADVLAPAQRGVAAVLHPVGDVVASTFHYGTLQAQNSELRQQIGRLNAQVASQDYANAQTAELYRLQNLPFALNVPKVPTEVISNSVSDFSDAAEISSGSSSGVGTGMPVVADGGLVGRISSQSRATAVVGLLTSSGNAVAVEDTATGAPYTVEGDGPGSDLTIVNTATSAAPKVGDLLVTSAKDAGAYPPGIPVGKVTLLSSSPGGLDVTVHVAPVADLSGLGLVAVLQWLAPA